MNIIRETRFRGILPAGLVLNAVMPPKISDRVIGVVVPAVSGFAGPLPNSEIAISLEGEFLDPVVIANLRRKGSFSKYVEGNPSGCPVKLDPFHDAVMLMTSVEFTGVIQELSGVEKVAYLPELTGAPQIKEFQSFYPLEGGSALTSEPVCAPALSCDVYIPKRCRFATSFLADQSTAEAMTNGVLGVNIAKATATSLPSREGYDFAISGYEFKLPALAHRGLVPVVPVTNAGAAARLSVVPATLRPNGSTGSSFASGRFAFSVCDGKSATILATNKDTGVPVLDDAFPQAASNMMYPFAAEDNGSFASFSQVGD